MTTVKRVCACRTPIESEPDPESIEHAVAIHQAEPEHRFWREREQLRNENIPGPSVLLGARATLRRIA